MRIHQYDKAEQRELLVKAKAGDRVAAAALVTTNVPFLYKRAAAFDRAFGAMGTIRDDLVSEGALGILAAIDRFDLDRPIAFLTYARWWIEAKMRAAAVKSYAFHNVSRSTIGKTTRARREVEALVAQGMSEHDACARVAPAHGTRAETLEYTIIQPQVISMETTALRDRFPDSGEDLEEQLIEREQAQRMRRVIMRLRERMKPRDQRILDARFYEDPQVPLATLAEEFGISRERVRQLEEKLLDRVRCALIRDRGADVIPLPLPATDEPLSAILAR